MDDMQLPSEPPESEAMPSDDANCDLRLDRITEYVSEALAAADPLAANVGVINGDLMHMAYALRQGLAEALQQPPESLLAMSEAMPAMDGFLKVTKQIDRFTQLWMKLR
jgi:hypothetical protein